MFGTAVAQSPLGTPVAQSPHGSSGRGRSFINIKNVLFHVALSKSFERRIAVLVWMVGKDVKG